jgi:hypothetical protein
MILNDNLVDAIENMQGTQGSLKVYFYLYKNFKEINLSAAQKGLELFSEHTNDAKKSPGSHPNIDRLINIIKSKKQFKNESYSSVITKSWVISTLLLSMIEAEQYFLADNSIALSTAFF